MRVALSVCVELQMVFGTLGMCRCRGVSPCLCNLHYMVIVKIVIIYN